MSQIDKDSCNGHSTTENKFCRHVNTSVKTLLNMSGQPIVVLDMLGPFFKVFLVFPVITFTIYLSSDFYLF